MVISFLFSIISDTIKQKIQKYVKTSENVSKGRSLPFSYVFRLEPHHEKTRLMPYTNNKGTDQPAHPRSLISAFVVRGLDNIIPILAKTLASLCSWAGRFEYSANPEDRFCRDVVHLVIRHWKNMSRSMTKPAKWPVRPAKTQISLGFRPVCSESSLPAWRNIGSLATHWAHSEDSDQTARMPRLSWVFAVRKCNFVGFVMLRFISSESITALLWHQEQEGKTWNLKMSRKTNKMSVRPAKTQIRDFAVRMKKPWALSYPLSAQQDSVQTGQMPRLIWVFAGRTLILLVLSCRGSYVACVEGRKTSILHCTNLYPGFRFCSK